MRNFKKLAVLLAVTLVLESFSPVSTSIAAENVGSEMFAAVEDVSLGDVSVGDALLTDVSADEVLDEIPADVSGADVEIEAPTTAETVSDGNVSEESIIEEPIIEEPAVEEPVAETMPEEAEVVEETEAQIEAIETPGNVAVNVYPVDGKTTTFYSGDMDFLPWGNGGKVVALAFFETATGVDESKFELDGTHFALFKKGEGIIDMDGDTYGVYVSVVDKTNIKLTFGHWTQCGTYTLYIPVSGCATNVMAEFNFTIKPSAYYATVYVNKNQQDIRIYTDGKKKLSLPLSAKALSQDELPVSLKNVKYALSKWSNQDEHVYISGSKLIIDKGFSGKKTFSVDATATDSSGHNVDAYIYGSIIVTSTPDVPRYLGVFEPDVEEPELFLEPLNPVYFKPGQLNGKEISIIDNENEYYIDASVKVSGKAIKLIPVDGCAYTTYRIEETGAGGDATITVTSDCGKQKAVFQIHIDKYDNTGLALYSESQQYEPMASSYECTGLFENFMVGKEKTETYEKIGSKIGNWTVSAKGAQVKVDEWGRIEYIPLQKNSTITLKAGKETKTYNITNTVLPETLPAAKNVSTTVCRVVYHMPLYREFTMKGLPVATNKFEFYEDFACTKKLKSAEANEQYEHLLELLNDGGFVTGDTQDKYIYGFDLDGEVPAGKYSFYVVPVEEVNWEDTCTTKPFKLTITVSAKIPKASVRLVNKTVEVGIGNVVTTGKIDISSVQNVYDVRDIAVLNGKSGNKSNQFLSYFMVSGMYPPTTTDGGSVLISPTEPHPETKNTKGIIRIFYQQMDGSMGYTDLPFTVKVKQKISIIPA